jgi:3-oxoadipate enol-lactonase
VPIAVLDDVELYYEERGQGAALLLIAGIPAVASDWAALAEPLSKSRRVITYDNRGSGRSSVPAGPYTTRQLAGDAVALLDHLDVARADVFGMSLGGMIAQEVALGWPERVNRLVLGCTHPGVRHAAPQPRESARAFALETDDWGLRMQTLAPFAFSSGASPQLLQPFIAKKSADVQDPVGYRAQIAAALSHDSRNRLGEIRSPTLILTGDDDRVIPAPSSEVLRDGIPGSTMRVIDGAGHLFFIEKPDQSLQLLETFLD